MPLPSLPRKNLNQVLLISTVFLSLFVAVSSASATTYYVKQDGTGDFTTIQACADAVSAGDTCIVYSGIYNERITLSSSHSGTAAEKTIFKAEPRRSVTMYGFAINNANYIRIEGFKVDPPGAENGIDLYNSNNNEIVDNHLEQIEYIAIDVNGESNYIANNYLYKPNFGLIISGKNHIIEGNEIDRLAWYGVAGDVDYSRMWGEGHIMRSNYFHHGKEAGYGHIDCMQSFDTNGNFLNNVLIEKNIFYQFHQCIFIEGGVYYGSSNFTIRNNVFVNDDREGGAPVLTWGVSDVTVVNNVFANAKAGVNLKDQTSSGFVKNNIFFDIKDASHSWDEKGYNLYYKCTYNPFYPDPTDLIDVDPMFVDSGSYLPENFLGPDGIPFTDDDGFMLQLGSPAIDSGASLPGLVDEDILGNPRPSGGGVGSLVKMQTKSIQTKKPPGLPSPFDDFYRLVIMLLNLI